jgi:hypothetical protein
MGNRAGFLFTRASRADMVFSPKVS